MEQLLLDLRVNREHSTNPAGDFPLVGIRPVELLKKRRHLPVVRLQPLYCIHLKTPCGVGRLYQASIER